MPDISMSACGFLLIGRLGMDLTIDLTEFNEARWWSQADVRVANPNPLIRST